mmetsp:Transcript_21568/g.51142  ORF Transcript_21568/g.51142 Transcript_21568/m.51142 type:complete len:208 (-) Transcript_21568:29-652(-)
MNTHSASSTTSYWLNPISNPRNDIRYPLSYAHALPGDGLDSPMCASPCRGIFPICASSFSFLTVSRFPPHAWHTALASARSSMRSSASAVWIHTHRSPSNSSSHRHAGGCRGRWHTARAVWLQPTARHDPSPSSTAHAAPSPTAKFTPGSGVHEAGAPSSTATEISSRSTTRSPDVVSLVSKRRVALWSVARNTSVTLSNDAFERRP